MFDVKRAHITGKYRLMVKAKNSVTAAQAD